MQGSRAMFIDKDKNPHVCLINISYAVYDFEKKNLYFYF